MRIQEATCPASVQFNSVAQSCPTLKSQPPPPPKKNDKEFRERETVLPGSKIFTDLGEVTWKEVQTFKQR